MAKWCIGIDLGGSFIKFGLLDEAHRATESFQLPTPTGSAEALVGQMVKGAREAMKRHTKAPGDVRALGIGAPGPLDMQNGILIAAPNLAGLTNVPLAAMLQRELGLPVALENDANAAAYGEFLCGAGKGKHNMVLFTLGTGIGSGIVVDGKLLHGAHTIGAEMGHMIVQPGGEPCNCGQRGCFERYGSATFMAQYARRLIEQNRKSTLADVLSTKGDIDAKDVNEARRAGDELAAEVWDRTAYYLAVACVSTCRIFDPEVIVLGGGMIKAGDDLLAPVRAHFKKLHWTITKPLTEILPASLGNDAGFIGAAGVAWDRFGA